MEQNSALASIVAQMAAIESYQRKINAAFASWNAAIAAAKKTI